MYLNLVAQLSQLGMNIFLLGLRFFTRTLELNQKWLPTRKPKDSIWVTCVTRRNQFGAYDPEMFPNEVTGVLLNL
jgi:hypothetical protein